MNILKTLAVKFARRVLRDELAVGRSAKAQYDNLLDQDRNAANYILFVGLVPPTTSIGAEAYNAAMIHIMRMKECRQPPKASNYITPEGFKPYSEVHSRAGATNAR